ncbi:MAG TPA: ABC transporter permease [Vicinamibacterales bacterium]|jgi:predicted permease|nr:ABC transporter permease [Vicinamibacterales bacterium]
MASFTRDIRYALRALRQTRGATFVAVISLALGVAVNTTVFSWARSVLLNPLPGVADSTRVVTIETVAPSGELIDSSYPDYRDFRDRATLLDGVIAFKERPLGLGEGDRAERIWSLLVSGNYFDVLGVKPLLGRFFEGAERSDAFDQAPVAVVGEAAWRSRFGADPGIVGRRILLNRHPYTVIGVAPAAFTGTITGLRFDLYVPVTMQRSLTGGGQWLAARGSRPLYLMARLRPGVAIDQARAEVRSIAAAAARDHADTNAGISASMLPLAEARRGIQSELGPLMRVLLALGALVLLIVCANVANLQLARGTARERETAIRLGLGAGPVAVMRQHLTESLVLAAAGCGLAVLAGAWLVDGLRLFTPFVEYPLSLAPAVGLREMGYAAGAALLAAVLVGIWPALRATRTSVAETLKSGSRAAGLDRRTIRFRAGLVAGEVALAMFALAAAGLLVRSFENTRRVAPGFDPQGVLLVGINLSTGGYDRAGALAYLRRAIELAGRVPGVEAVSMAEDVPLGFNGGSWEEIAVPGYAAAASENMRIYRNLVAPGYFALMRIPLLGGRDFTAADDRDAPMVAIVNEEFARRYFGGRDAVGRTFEAFGQPHRIVGVVRTTRYHTLAEAPQPYFYLPLEQHFSASTGVALHVRTSGDPLAVAGAVRAGLVQADAGMPTGPFVTLADYMGASYFAARTAAMLMGVLAALALALASIGLYSLIAFDVSARRQELGVRVALGAASADIIRLVVFGGARTAAWGIAAGCVLALAGTRALGALLFGVSPLDAPTLAAAVALLGGVALLASYIPARAAARLDPMSALRAE